MPLFPTITTINAQLDDITGGSTFLALYTATPNSSGGGTEVTGGSYSRNAITWGSTVTSTVSGNTVGTRSNTVSISFTGMPAATVTHYGILTSSTGGTLRAFGALNAPLVAVAGDEIIMSVGTVQASVAGS